MNSSFAKRSFASLYNYSCKNNPRVYFTLSRDGAKLGDLVFEVYANHVPKSAENFLSFVKGNTLGSYKGTSFKGGFPGIVLQGGRVTECNASADGSRAPDENMTLRHFKRGVISFTNDGENSNGSEFQIALSETANLLNGYHTVVGELVEGGDVLSQAEQSLNRHGSLDHSLKIEDCGTR
jgi:peptidyl-prolyl isomerase F (cyclophilin D)